MQVYFNYLTHTKATYFVIICFLRGKEASFLLEDKSIPFSYSSNNDTHSDYPQ